MIEIIILIFNFVLFFGWSFLQSDAGVETNI